MQFEIYLVLLANALLFSNSEANRSSTNGKITETTIRENFWNRSGIVTELQHTICSIKTDEVVAKAQSTASRILTGICTLEDMRSAFVSMEKVILQRLDEVQRNLTMLIQSKLTQTSTAPKKNQEYTKVSAFRTIKELFDKSLFEDTS